MYAFLWDNGITNEISEKKLTFIITTTMKFGLLISI